MTALHPTGEPRIDAPLITLVARTLGVIISVGWLFILVSSVVFGGWSSIDREGALLGSLTLMAVIGVGVAFAKEDTGGSIALVAGLALSLIAAATAGRNHWLAVMVSGAPFVVCGLLFMVSSKVRSDRR